MKSMLQVCAIAIFVTLASRSGFAQVSPPGKTAALQAYEQGHYEDAEKLYLRAIDETNESKADTSYMAVLLNNLAVVYVAEDRWADASRALRQAVELCEKKTSTANDLALAASFNKLGRAYQSHSEYTDAERLLKTALATREQIVGPANSATATSLESLASLLFEPRHFGDAL
jgi:tetratricopeptide (TPR) repeat protein